MEKKDGFRGNRCVIARFTVEEDRLLENTGHDCLIEAMESFAGNMANEIVLDDVIISDHDDTVAIGRYCHYLLGWAMQHFLEEDTESPMLFDAFLRAERHGGNSIRIA